MSILSLASVVILTYNKQEGPLNILKKLPPGPEYIVIDDGSDSNPIIPEGVTFESLRPKQGIRAATCRNRGAELATRPHIVFLDDDIEPNPNVIFAHTLALQMYDVSLGIICADGFKVSSDDRLSVFIHQSHLWRFCYSGNMAIRKDLFEKIGGFDEIYNGGHGFEDIDLGRKAFQENARFVLNPLAVVSHPHQQTFMTDNPLVLENMKKLEKKWGEMF